MRDIRPPTLIPTRSTAPRATERLAWTALQRGRRRRRARAVITIVIAALAHLAVAVWVMAGFLGSSHGTEAAAKAHAVVALLQTTRIARDGKSTSDADADPENAGAARKTSRRGDFLPLVIVSPPPAAARQASAASAPLPPARRAPLARAPSRPTKDTRSDDRTSVDKTASHSLVSPAASRPQGMPTAPRSADDIEATAARLALAAGVTAASAGRDAAPAASEAAAALGTASDPAGTGDRGAAAPTAASADPHVAGTTDAASGPPDTAGGAASAASATSAAIAAGPSAAMSSAIGASGSGANADSGVSGTATPGAAQQGTRFALLPSSDLVYDTFYNGAQNQSGTLHWRTDGRHYSLLVSMPVPFIGTFSYRSEGHIDDYGLAPDTYTETRGRRGESVSRFIREGDAPHASFTRSPTDVPLAPGAQDRFSMIFQLASLVRADPSRYQPGVTRVFDVIDSNSAETWPIQTIGPDHTLLGTNQVETLHFMRLPRKPGDKRRIDVWLAPSMNWIPVRIMQTEPNGTQIELVFHARLPPD